MSDFIIAFVRTKKHVKINFYNKFKNHITLVFIQENSLNFLKVKNLPLIDNWKIKKKKKYYYKNTQGLKKFKFIIKINFIQTS